MSNEQTIRNFNILFHNGIDGNHLFKTVKYRGVFTSKYPTDLWCFQEIIYKTKPEVIIECGVFCGGTTLFLADLCNANRRGVVLACDISLGRVYDKVKQHPRVELFEGSSTHPLIRQTIARKSRNLNTMVILDSDHSQEHVAEELRLYSPLVTPGCYLIVEDTNINGHPVADDFGPGPYEAVQEFLTRNSDFEVDVEQERFLVTANPSGYLRKTR